MRVRTLIQIIFGITIGFSLQAAPAISSSPNSPYRQLSVLLEEMSQMKEKLEAIEGRMGSSNGEGIGTLQYQEAIQQQQAQMAALEANQKNFQNQVRQSLLDNEAVKGQIQSMQRQLAERLGENQAVQNALKQLEMSWEDIKKDMARINLAQTKQASRVEAIERTGAAAKVVQQHSEQLQALQALLKQQSEDYNALKSNLAQGLNDLSSVAPLKQKMNDLMGDFDKIKEQNTDKTLLLGKIYEENEGLRHRLEQIAPTTQLVQQQHDKIKQLSEDQQALQLKLQQQEEVCNALKLNLAQNANGNKQVLLLQQQVAQIENAIHNMKDQTVDKSAILEQISEEAQARKIMFEQLKLANDALKTQIQSGGGALKSEDLMQLQQRVNTLLLENQKNKTAQASLERHYQMFFDEVNKQLKAVETALDKSAQRNLANGDMDLLQEQLNSLKRDMGDKWKDLADKCKNMCASTLNQTNDRLQSLAQQMQSNFEHLREKTFAKHIILSGESLTSIAKRYQTTPAKILSINNLPSAKNLKVGDVLWIPKEM